MQRPIVDGIAIRCRDLTKSLDFYQGLLGFELDWQDNDMAGLRVPSPAGDFSVTLDQIDRGPEPVKEEFGIVIGLRVADVAAVAERLAAAGHGMRIRPADGPVEQQNAAVFDPDGHELWLSASA